MTLHDGYGHGGWGCGGDDSHDYRPSNVHSEEGGGSNGGVDYGTREVPVGRRSLTKCTPIFSGPGNGVEPC